MSDNLNKRKYIFLLQLNERAEKEESYYARLLFQENILSTSIIATIFTIESFLNKKVREQILTDDRKLKIKHNIKIKFDPKTIETKTLGQLCSIINPFLEGNDNLKSSLKSFVNMRNNITHKMFVKYKNMEELEEDSQKVVKIGEKAIRELAVLRSKIFLCF